MNRCHHWTSDAALALVAPSPPDHCAGMAGAVASVFSTETSEAHPASKSAATSASGRRLEIPMRLLCLAGKNSPGMRTGTREAILIHAFSITVHCEARDAVRQFL